MIEVCFAAVFLYIIAELNKQERPQRDVKTTTNGSPRLIHYGLINKHSPTMVFKKYALLLCLRKENEKEFVLVLKTEISDLSVFTF